MSNTHSTPVVVYCTEMVRIVFKYGMWLVVK